jgi:hypothetical protein
MFFLFADIEAHAMPASQLVEEVSEAVLPWEIWRRFL